MKYLKDLSIFKKQKAQVDYVHNLGVTSVYGEIETEGIFIEDKNATEEYPLISKMIGLFDSDKPNFKRRKHQNCLTLEFILSGENYLRCGERGYIAEARDLCLLHPNMDCDLLLMEEQRYKKYGVLVYGTNLSQILTALNLDNVDGVRIAPQDMPMVIDIFERLHKTFLCTPMNYNDNAGYTFEILQIISRLKKVAPVEQDIELVIHYFEKNLHKKINIDDVAKMINKSAGSVSYFV